MTELVTTRWRKYGKDRLYVKTPDGIDVGIIDLVTGAIEVKVAEFDGEIRALATPHQPAALSTDTTSTLIAPASPAQPVSVAPAARNHVATSLHHFSPQPTQRLDSISRQRGRRRGEGQASGGQWAGANPESRCSRSRRQDRRASVARRCEGRGEGRPRTRQAARRVARPSTPFRSARMAATSTMCSICTRGVFTLNTKNHPDGAISVYERAVWVNGHSTDYLRNSRFEAKRVPISSPQRVQCLWRRRRRSCSSIHPDSRGRNCARCAHRHSQDTSHLPDAATPTPHSPAGGRDLRRRPSEHHVATDLTSRQQIRSPSTLRRIVSR